MRKRPLGSAYIIAARRTALGRVGGLHKNRRLEDLTAPVVGAVLADCGVPAARVDEIVLGNATQGGNPARLVALAAGLPETVSATTIDRQCGSGLDAILAAIRSVEGGEADVVIAGGAESISTAPWRIAKPRSLYQLPHFLPLEPAAEPEGAEEPALFESSEALSRKLGIGRAQQDAWAMRSHLKAEAAREARRLVGEIVPLRANAEEARDQSAGEPDAEDLEQLSPFIPPDGTLTPGNTSAVHDGAALVVVVSEELWEELGKPRALRLVASAAQGVAPGEEAGAPIEAMRKLYDRLNGFNPKDIGTVEMSESSAAQAIAFAAALGLEEDIVNPAGGAVVRGHPFGAAGAVLVVRLFSTMARGEEGPRTHYGVAALGALGGIGLAALFEAV
jgi:acetyl-CoA C-acetyltransferase